MGFELRQYQKEAVDAAYKYLTGRSKKPGVVVAPTGCHAKGTEILMYNGTIKKVEDIEVGDELVGDDGHKRTVMKLHRGTDRMYRITPVKGKPFIVNQWHILSLYKTNEGKSYPSSAPRYDEISVVDYEGKSNNYKHLHKLYKPQIVYFKERPKPEIDPYFIGLYLGDGCSANGTIEITSMRTEVEEYLNSFVKSIGLRVSKKNKENCKAYSYAIIKTEGKYNPLIEYMKKIGIHGLTAFFKFIPVEYLSGSVEDRLNLLAGFMDTDAYYDKEKNTYEYCTMSKQLAKDVEMLCRSLGFACNIGVPKIVNNEEYYRMQISGDLDKIPVKVAIRKGRPRGQKKSQLVTGFSIKYIGKGHYYGFEVDGNHLYCDAQFFVHHNSGKSILIGSLVNKLGGNTIILQPSKEILVQNYNKAVSFGMEPTIYSASCKSKELSGLTYATLKSIKKEVENISSIGIKYILVDECHLGYSAEEGSEFMNFISGMGDVKVLGFTATPCRLHNYSSLAEGNYSKLNMLTKDDPRFFENIVHVTQVQELTRQGFWAKMKYEVWNFDESGLMLNSTGAEYTDDSIKRCIERNGVNNGIYKRILQLMQTRKHILVCMDSIESCKIITDFINKKFGYICDMVTSKTTAKKREKVINDFKSGAIKIVFNYSALATGFDFPELDCVVMGRPTFSFSIYSQFAGRGVRPHPDKEDCLFVDCCNNYKRFGAIENVTVEHYPGRGWCMFSGDKLMTGVRLDVDVTRQMLEARTKSMAAGGVAPAANDTRPSHTLENTIMSFGKYEGHSFKNIPISYFRWLIENMDKPDNKFVEYYKSIII